jgi:hypothetical protein
VPEKSRSSAQMYRPRALVMVGSAAVLGFGMLTGAATALAAPTQDAVDAIHDRYEAFTSQNSFLGTPVGAPVDVVGGARQDYTGGAIYYSQKSGAHVMYGEILKKYQNLGGPDSGIGFPTNDEADSGDSAGRFNDFSQPGGAAIYWNPNTGAWVIRGRVLDAWRASGGVKGPFSYPGADQTEVNGLSTATFVGPQGTEITWSDAAGLATLPPALAATIPGFTAGSTPTSAAPTTTAEGTTSVATPETTVTAPTVDTPKSSFNWWPVIIGLAILGLLAWLFRALSQRRKVAAPVVRAPEVARPVAPKPPPVVPPPAPRVQAPPPPPPPPAPKPVPKVQAPPPPPPAPKPVVPPPAPKAEPVAPLVDIPEPKAAPMVVNYDDDTAHLGRPLEVTYENNAVGDDQQSRADKSDSVPD